MYASIANMMTRFGTVELIQLTDEAGAGVIDEATVTAALVDGDNEINSYLIGVYQRLPLDPAPGILEMHACHIARYRLHKNGVPDQVQKEYDQTIDWLKLVAKGTVKLEVAGIEAPSAPNTIVMSSEDRIFTRDSLRGF